MRKFRIKENALNQDGTNIWFYPEILITKTETIIEGSLWWKTKKEIKTESWQRFFNIGGIVDYKSEQEIDKMWIQEQKQVIAFRTLQEADDWYKKYINEQRKSYEDWWKFVGGQVEYKETKTHEVKID